MWKYEQNSLTSNTSEINIFLEYSINASSLKIGNPILFLELGLALHFNNKIPPVIFPILKA